MAKATTIKDALKRWEEKHEGEKLEEALEVGLQFQWLPIEKLDNSLSVLQKCEKLSVSSNMIDKITGISSLKNLKVLALSRNYIKTFAGLESLGETLEELWMSYNLVEKTKGIDAMKKLKVLYLGNNNVKDWAEFNRFQQMASLEDLLFVGNPLYEAQADVETYTREVLKRLPKLRKLEGETVVGGAGDD